MKLWMPDVVKGSEKDNILYRLQYTNQFKNRIKTELKEENQVKIDLLGWMMMQNIQIVFGNGGDIK